jgi:hypothetical protein
MTYRDTYVVEQIELFFLAVRENIHNGNHGKEAL